MQTALTSDLVRDSKLKTTLNGDITRHVIEIPGRSARQRKIQKVQLWKKAENLGHGTFGSVWLEKLVGGESVVSERAVKVIKKQVQKSKVIDYSHELEAIAKFSHPRYVSCFVESFGWFESESHVHIAMEYFPLGDLQAYLSTSLSENEVQQISFQILEGLDSMHCNGFAHRDLKPSNILVKSTSPDWWVKIGDFGISKRAEEGLTALRSFSGTLGFLAPEILAQNGLLDCEEFGERSDYTVAVDLWSLGEIIFRALTNEPPFRKGLASYIKGTSSFPIGALQAHKVSSEGCDLLRDLLRPMPADRLTAEAALRHPWIVSQQKSSPRSSAESQRPQADATIVPSSFSGMVDLGEHDPPRSLASAVWSTLQNDSVGRGDEAGIQLDAPTETGTSEQIPSESQIVPLESCHETDLSTEYETARDDKVTDYQSDAPGELLLQELENGQYLAGDYVSHQELADIGKLVVMTSKSIVMVEKEDLAIQWELLLKNVKTIVKKTTGLQFWLRGGVEGPYIRRRDRQSLELLWKQVTVTVAVHAYDAGRYATKAKENATRLLLGPMPQTSPDLKADPQKGRQESRSPDADSETDLWIKGIHGERDRGPYPFQGRGMYLTMMDWIETGRPRPLRGADMHSMVRAWFTGPETGRGTLNETAWLPINPHGLVKHNQDLGTADIIRQAQESLLHFVDQAEGPQPVGETTLRAKSLAHAHGESIQARRARREQAKEFDAGELAAQVEHTQLGSSQDTEIKPVFLKGLFSVSTTSSKPLSVIQSEIIRVLDQLGVQWEETKWGFKCQHSPTVDLRDETSNLPTSGLVHMVLVFEMLIVKVPLFSLHGIQFRKVEGGTWQYKNMAQTILTELRV